MRKRKAIDQANYEMLVNCILANCLRTVFYRASDRVAYLRTADAYSNGPPWLNGRALARTVDAMVAADLLSHKMGERAKFSSTFNMSLMLINLLVQAYIDKRHITRLRLDDRSLIRLRDCKANGKIGLQFEANEQTNRWCSHLREYNEFLAGHDLSIDLREGQISELLADGIRRNGLPDNQPVSTEPELFENSIFRVFNNGSFDQGGRLYGGWWINMPKPIRKRITINGEPTTELDYSGLAVRMLYHLEGINYRDDPYAIPELTTQAQEIGKPATYYREAVKRLFQAMLNDVSEGGHPESIALDISFHPYFRRLEITNLIEGHHPTLIKYFRSGYGLKLQRYDSDIALDVITKLRERGIPALPVHDSFIVKSSDKCELEKVMVDSYENKFGFKPIVN